MSAEPTPSPSSSKCDIDSVDIKEAVNHLIQGKRHMLVQDYASAVSSLQTATELFASKYGEMANECGDAYFSYGKALLELARMETGVLGNALDGVPEEEENESEESESSSDQVENTNKLSAEEKIQIAEQVDRALEETSRELDEKVASWKCREIEKQSSKKKKDVAEVNEFKQNQNISVTSDAKATSDDPVSQSNDPGSDNKCNRTSGTHLNFSNLTNGHDCSPVKDENLNGELIADGNINAVPPTDEDNENKENLEPVNKVTSDDLKSSVKVFDKKIEDEEGSEEKDDDDDENDEEKEEEIDHSPEPKDKENNDAEEGGKPEEDEDDDKEEEVTNLQLSWEVIELAKIIFERQCDSNNNTMKLKTADAYLKLGEIAIESGNYSQAIDDLNRCHKIRTEILQPDDRLIAETFYQLGLAFSFNSEFDKGKEKFEEALKVIKERLLNLENSLESVKDDYEQFDKCAREIDDLKGLIPEINNKIDDTEDMKKNAIKAQADAIKEALAKEKVLGGECSTSQGGFPSGFTSGSTADGKSQIGFTSGSPTKPVTNIGHLIRKKRKPEESDQTMEIKKSRTSEDNKTNINLNGNMENSSENKSTQDSCQDVAAS